MAKTKEINELECECGHVAGAPATLRIHKNTAHSVVVEEAQPVKKVTKKKTK